MTVFQDKKAILHVFSGLMDEPYKLDDTESHQLTIEDFPERFHKIVFSAITNLHEQGVERINAIEVDGYLSRFPEQYHVFNENSGFEYLTKVEELGEPENYQYHLNRIKKYSFLRECVKSGIDISDIYDETLIDITETEEQQSRFDEISLDEMMSNIETRMINLRDKFLFESISIGSHMGDDVNEMIEEYGESPNFGYPTPSEMLNSVARGNRLRKFYCFSGNTGSGKTRMLLASVLMACVPEIYDKKSGQWIKTGANGRGLFISTELEEEEIKIPAVCFIAEVEENKIHEGGLTEEEKERLKYAAEVLKKSAVWFEELHDFDMEDLEHVIVKNIHQNQVEVVSFDYLHTTLKLFDSMARQGARNLQEHQVLRLMSIRLKNMCNKHNIWIGTATQLNDNYKQEGNLDQSSIEGSKSVANKFDLGAIQIPLSPRDEKIVQALMEEGIGFSAYPTHTINIYKNRGGRHKMVRLFVSFNLGTLRMEDVFVTDYQNKPISDVKPRKIEFKIDDDEVIDMPVDTSTEYSNNPIEF